MGLDIGTSEIKALGAALRPDNKKLEVLGRSSEPSFGVRKGVVVDTDKVAGIVSSVLEKLEKETGREVREVFVTIGGGHIFSTTSEGTVAVSRADQIISEEDVSRVVDAARTFSLKNNREILRVFPQEYRVDDEEGVREPVGMKGVRLEAGILVIGYFSPYLENLTETVLSGGYQVGHVMTKPMASAKAVLTPREKELGVLMVNIGAGTTSFAAFKEKTLLKVGVVPVGSFNVTKDIAIGLKTDIDTADMIKLEHGGCFLGGRKKIEVEEERSKEKISFSESELGKIIDARAKEVFKLVKNEFKEVSSAKLAGGVVVTGGGARLPGIEKMAKKELGFATRIGAPLGFMPELRDPSLSAVCGLVREAREFAEEEKSWTSRLASKIKKMFKDFIP